MNQRNVDTTVLLLAPPYREFGPPVHIDASTLLPPRGSIAVVQATVDTPWPNVVMHIERLHRYLATCPVVLWIEGSATGWMMRHGVHAAALTVRAYLIGTTIDIVNLRGMLCDLAAFPRQLTHWLIQRRFRITPSARDLLEIISACDLGLATFTEMLRSIGEKERPWRSEFTRSGLGSPGAWFHIVRMVRIATEIQAHPGLSVSTLAERYGFYDVAHLRHRLDDVIGGNPSTIRNNLGWEWMMFSALRRCAIAPPPERERERERERRRHSGQ